MCVLGHFNNNNDNNDKIRQIYNINTYRKEQVAILNEEEIKKEIPKRQTTRRMKKRVIYTNS